MELKKLQELYLNGLKEEGYKGEVSGDDDIGFTYQGGKYWITPYENDPEFFQVSSYYKWSLEDNAEKIKVLLAFNTVNKEKKLAKIYINADFDLICVTVGFFVKEPKDFIANLSRSLGMIQGMMDSFVDEMKKE